MKHTGINRDQSKEKSTLTILRDYLSRQSNFKTRISVRPTPNLGYVVVIPALNESGLLRSLNSLRSAFLPGRPVEVVVVLNSAGNDPEKLISKHRSDAEEIKQWNKQFGNSGFKAFPILLEQVPSKFAGAGYARKTGMDEAISRFIRAGSGKGVICSFDADTVCDKNYFLEIEKVTRKNPPPGAGSVYFEHPVTGNLFPSGVYQGIILYELHLRYFLQALRFSGFPYVHHTVGSAFFVTAGTYARAGGMNRRKAGEDFYFLQKIMPDVHYVDVITTTVQPSPRPSNRVPFGTGPWIKKFMNGETDSFYTYNLDAFRDLALFFGKVNELAVTGRTHTVKFYSDLPAPVRSFIRIETFRGKVEEIKRNTASPETFVKRFFKWFNGFQVVKYLNESHKEYYSRMDIKNESERFLRLVKNLENIPESPLGKLNLFREMEKDQTILPDREYGETK